MANEAEYSVLIHEEDGTFWAEVEELPGCFAAGDTEDELWASLAEAMSLYLSTPGSPVGVTVRSHERVSRREEQRVLIDC